MVGTAIVALGDIGPDAKTAAPHLLNIAKDKGQKARYSALLALVKIGLDAKIAVPLLMEALRECSDDKVGRQQPWYLMHTLIRDLGEIGPAAKDATAVLMTIARDLKQEEWIRKEAADAVLKIDPALGVKEKMEVAYLNVRLNPIPKIKLLPRTTLSEEKKKHIKSLIAKLADITNPDFGISATLTGDAFAPLPEQERFQSGVLTDHRNKTASAFRSLVEMGPDALPLLLEALTDSTPTKLKVEHKFAVGGMYLGGEIKGNPLNPVERSVLSKKATDEDDEENGMLTRPYNVTAGDVCFVAIGQIVSRPYSAVRYQPIALITINSPQASKELRDRVRAIWSSDDPAKRLLDSLLIDYATEGLFNGESLDGWYEGSDRQIQAATRLLYYFPKETAALIAERLRALDVQRYEEEAYIKREVKNGVRTIDFIKAVSWSDDPAIRVALAGIAQRTDDKQIKQVLSAGRK